MKHYFNFSQTNVLIRSMPPLHATFKTIILRSHFLHITADSQYVMFSQQD